MEGNDAGGIKFEGYDQPQRIGKGGMATVWKARQISLDRWVAIKVLSPEQCNSDEDIDRFQAEARAAARMNHPSIVQVYDAFYRNDRFCFVMEFIDGHTVAAWIVKRGYIPQDACLFVAAGVAGALGYAWERQRLVHCDIKPDNIMIDVDGSVKVTDFGLSKSMFTSQARRMTEQEHFVLGTPAYISPEQAVGSEELFIQADMYSLGATLYHMSTGRRLFHDQSGADMMEAQVNLQDTDPFDLNSQLSPCFCDFLERLLCKNPEDRYDRWSDVVDEIENLRQNRPLKLGEINPSTTRSTLRRSPLRDAARAEFLSHAQDAAATSAPASTPEAVPAMPLGAPSPATTGVLSSFSASDSPKAPVPPLATRFTPLFSSRPFKAVFAAAAILSTIAGAVWIAVSQRRASIQRTAQATEAVMREIENHLRIKPDDYTVAIARYHDLMISLKKPAHADLRQQINNRYMELRKDREQHIERVLSDLRKEIRPYIEERQFVRAAEIVRSYNGPLAEETKKDRAQMADQLNEQARRFR
ncbi:MAG: serine/threonine protein kinase [Kiritimatiellia bacterium]|jgi:serine/threonine protein kinase